MKDILSTGIQRLLQDRVSGYVQRSSHGSSQYEKLRAQYSLDRIIRLDLGINPDGCPPGVSAYSMTREKDFIKQIHRYPELELDDLERPLSTLHEVPKEWFVFSAGLEQMIALLAQAFLNVDDSFIQVVPSFFLFDEYSRRVGALPLYINLSEETQFDFTEKSLDSLGDWLRHRHPCPKLLWIANPNNPTGRTIDLGMIQRVVELALAYDICVVVDEAYGEYQDPPSGVRSASSLLSQYQNLVVLRTFSKAWGLANLRVGYAIASNTRIIEALQLAQVNFPIDSRAFSLATRSLQHMDWLDHVRFVTRERREHLYQGLAAVRNYSWVQSQSAITMVRHKTLPAKDLIVLLRSYGIIVAPISPLGSVGTCYVRITLSTIPDLDVLLGALAEIA